MLLGFVTIVSLFMLFRLSLYIHFNKHEMCFLETVLCYLSLLSTFLYLLCLFSNTKKTFDENKWRGFYHTMSWCWHRPVLPNWRLILTRLLILAQRYNFRIDIFTLGDRLLPKTLLCRLETLTCTLAHAVHWRFNT